MSILTKLLRPFDHCEDTAAYLLSELGVSFTATRLQKELKEHPDYPSLLSIADVIGHTYNIDSIPLKTERKKILEIDWINVPFIAHLESHDKKRKFFGVITKFTNDKIDIYHSGIHTKETISSVSFDKQFLGTILAVQADSDSAEKDYIHNLRVENQMKFRNGLLLTILPILTLIIIGHALLLNAAISVIIPSVFTLLTLIGCVVTVLLLWYEVDNHNPALRQICQAGKKVNCTAILTSKASKVFGLSWSSIGFSYFAGMLTTLLVSGIESPHILSILSWINILSLPYIFFSVYYQWKIAKQWCLLCLVVQGLLLLQFVILLVGGYHFLFSFAEFSLSRCFSVIAAFGFSFTTIVLLVPVLQKSKEANQLRIEMQRMKHNPQIFEALLFKQRSIEMPSKDIGISIGNPNGRFKIIKVCNPFCGPCANAHPVLEALVENNDQISLQIIFTVSISNKNAVRPILSHFFAINSRNDETQIKHAMDDWYLSHTFDYIEFAAKYPLKGEESDQELKINDMEKWCGATGIQFTPTFFICMDMSAASPKFFQLPSQYSVNDLHHFLAI